MTQKELTGLVKKGFVIIMLVIIINKVFFQGQEGGRSGPPPIPFAVPASYSCILTPKDAERLKDHPVVKYWVRRQSSTQIDLVATAGDVWQSVIRFDPSQKPPYVAICEEIDNGVFSPGVMKLTPNLTGGFDFEYLEEGDSESDKGVLRPNWY